MSQSTKLDPAALERLHRLGGEEFVGKMMDLFLDFTAAKIREAWAAHAAGKPDALAKAVHPIKSSAGNIGATSVQELALRLELTAERGQFEPVGAWLDELEQAFAEAKLEIERRKVGLGISCAPGHSDVKHPNSS